MSDFVHLHTHTHFSMQESTILPKQLFKRCKTLGMKAIAVTDYASVFNMPELFSYANEEGIKLIIGAELYMVDGSMLDKVEQEIFNLVLLVKTQTGYQNLSRILSASARDGFYKQKPRADVELIKKYHEGLICLSGSQHSQLERLLLSGDKQSAKQCAKTYKSIFGEDYYIELANHFNENDERLNQEKVALANELEIELVASNNVHYLEKKHWQYQDALQAIKNKQILSAPDRIKLPTKEYYLKSPDEMAALFDNEHNELSNTKKLADKCTYKFEDEEPKLPHFSIPEEFEDEKAYLRFLTYEGAARKYGDLDAMAETGREIKTRIEYELEIITGMGFSSYFLIVSDLIAASRKMGYSVGPGRGSAAGSIVAYLTDITQIDPIKYKLLFERFLNPERISMPDIDIDFTPVGKQKVLDYTIKKYGAESVAKVIAIGTLGAKAAIRDVGRVLNLPLQTVDRIAKLVPSKPGTTLAKAFKQVQELRDLEKSPDQKLRRLMEFAKEVEGRARNVSMHAAAVVITDGPIEDVVPLYVSNKIVTEERRYADEESLQEEDPQDKSSAGDKQVVSQFDKDWIEKAGLLKIDYLGLETLAVVDETLRLIKRRYGVEIDLEKIPMDDKPTFKIFQEAKMAGIFQFESRGMQKYMKRLRPTVIGDIIAMSALYRPGALNAKIDERRNAVDLFVDRKNGREEIAYMHSSLEEVLAETYGVIVYQEQVMQISQIMGGFTLGKADKLRKAMGKKKPEIMAKFKDDFIEGAVAQEIDKAIAEKVFDLMAEFAGYGFNKSHSASYGVLAYWTGYLKAHYTAEFMTAILNSEAGDTDRMRMLTDEAKSLGLTLLSPDINISDALFTVEATDDGKKAIRAGFSAIKHVGGAAKEIVRVRKRKGKPFDDIFDFCTSVDLRIVNKKALECLTESGAMDSLLPNRAMLFHNLSKIVDVCQKHNKKEMLGQEGFFNTKAYFQENIASIVDMEEVEDWEEMEKLKREKNLSGFYLSKHPLESYRRDYEAFCTIRLSDRDYENKRLQKVIGMVSDTKKHLDKKGNTMMFGVIEDFESKADFTVFASVYEHYQDILKKDAIVMLITEAELKDGQTKLLVSEVIPIDEVRERCANQVILQIRELNDDVLKKIKQVKSICEEHKGPLPLRIDLEIMQNDTYQTLNLFARKITLEATNDVLERFSELLGSENVKLAV